MKIFIRYVLELAIIIPDALFIFIPAFEYLRWRKWITCAILGIILPAFVLMFSWVCAENLLEVIPALVVSVMFLFIVFFFSVDMNLGKKLFCFFNSVMLGAFCLLYAITITAYSEAKNELWASAKLMTHETGLVSLGLSVLICGIFLKFLTKELPMLLQEDHINRIWEFLFLVPLGATLLISWLTPQYPNFCL